MTTPARPPLTGTQADYARHRGVSRSAVNKAVHAGRIPLTPEGRIDFAAADLAWRSNTDPSKPSNTVSPPSAPSLPTGDTELQLSPLSYADARALREYNLARLADLDFRQKSGSLVEVVDVKDIAFRAARAARDLILAAPDRLAPLVCGLSDQAEVHRILTEDLMRACEELMKIDPTPPDPTAPTDSAS